MNRSAWSTADAVGERALDRWRAVVGQSLFALDIGSSAPDFYARIEQGPFGPSILSKVEAGPQSVRRTRRCIAAGPRRATIDLISVRSGAFRFSQHGREDVVCAGDCVLLDRTTPYAFDATESCALTLNLDHDWLARWAADPVALTGRRIDGARGWGLALSAMLAQLEVGGLDRLALPSGAVADQIASLLVLACTPPDAPSRADRRMFARLLQIIRDRAHDPDFTPDNAAAAAGISKRYLHLLFAREGGSFGRHLMAERLDRARAILADPRHASLPVGEIALRCGFLDPGHFAKRFRARFGTSPSGARGPVHS